MAVVYLAHDLHLGRDVAVKTLRSQFAVDPTFRARFEREARAAASLSHPNIIDVYDVGEDDGVPYLVMEVIRGQALKAIIATDAPFHPDDVAQLLEQIGAALDHAHARGYVHRDVKPGNILIDEHGRARMVDFGIAKSLADSDLTEAGGGFGTALYISPEQAEGLMATPASDIYATGVVAYEMLTGSLPFTAETSIGLAMQHLNDPAPAPSRAHPGIPPAVDAIVLRALDKDPTRRWQSVGAFARALRGWRSVDPRQLVPPPRAAAPAQSGSSTLPTILVIIVVIAALAFLLWIGFSSLPGSGDPEPAAEPRTSEPTITGGISGDDPVLVAGEPELDLTSIPTLPAATIVPTQVVAPPTIAPRTVGTVEVPNLQGLSIARAVNDLIPLGLRVALGEPTFSDAAPRNAVVSQEPPPGAAVPPGTTVRISLSRGPSPFREDTQP